MKKIKICTPVMGKTINEFLKNLDKVQEISQMIELRVDSIKNLSKENLKLIRKKTKKEAIFTSRKKEIILKALDLKFDFVDIDFSSVKNFNLIQIKKETKVIISFHDFKKTPPLIILKNIQKKMKRLQPDVMKFATMVNNDTDIKNLLKLLLSKEKNEKIIVIGMGKKGRIARVVGPLLGSFLTYASTKFGTTAQGQINIKKMKNIYKLLVTNN